MGQYPCKSILQDNIKSLREETWEAIHEEILGYARREGIETGRKIRVDSTAVETDIHHPTDSTLLFDGIRVMTRWLACGKQLTPQPGYVFSDHTRVAKKRVMVIVNAKKDTVRQAAYRDLLAYAERVAGYAVAAIPELRSFEGADPRDTFAARALAENLERAVGLLRRVIDQTDSASSKVPHQEDRFFFEEHADIIVRAVGYPVWSQGVSFGASRSRIA
jgi:IS5 family transposase